MISLRCALFAIAVILGGSYRSGSETLVGWIQKIDGDKITLMKIVPLTTVKNGAKLPAPVEKMTFTAVKTVKVTLGKFDPASKDYSSGDPVNGGLKNKLFQNATVFARLVIKGGLATEVLVIIVQPNNEFTGVITKIEGKKLTFSQHLFTKPPTPPSKDNIETIVTLADDYKVTEAKLNDKTDEYDVRALEGGLDNKVFKKNVRVLLVTDDQNKVVEIRVLEAVLD